jgi:hypothetical protein
MASKPTPRFLFLLRTPMLVLTLWAIVTSGAVAEPGPINAPPKASKNGIYFEDANGTPLILCGSQTWNTLQD